MFLDVPALLELSVPRGRLHRGGWLLPAAAVFILIVLGSAYLSGRSPEWRATVQWLSTGTMGVIVVAMSVVMWLTVRGQREERQQIEALEELVQLRRWPQAGSLLDYLLSRPMRSQPARAHALIYLSSVLARYGRFDDAIAVQNHLLTTERLDGSTRHALRLGRAMAMLREDHLVDADRAINELRKDVARAGEAAARRRQRQSDIDAPTDAGADEREASAAGPEAEADGGADAVAARPGPDHPPAGGEAPISAGLALIEIYRDVKTGHPEEAIALFRKSLVALRAQLGHRVADAYALVARAYDFLGRNAEAHDHWTRATLLSPALELQRRYPELASVSAKYPPALAPSPEGLF